MRTPQVVTSNDVLSTEQTLLRRHLAIWIVSDIELSAVISAKKIKYHYTNPFTHTERQTFSS